ncbi:hypothetical protein JRQ81_005556 [Phrynocephalus forsythii]|uniref:Butyrophilin subfamily 1 member A1-like n=1 Tax=Phrynocephalus forsythii TaxID=171643 RepID=A0A9Q0XGZ3_9SAUR|nr:hypothetical protein JRQ81_005556 [Phrynocephalus forsythii]
MSGILFASNMFAILPFLMLVNYGLVDSIRSPLVVLDHYEGNGIRLTCKAEEIRSPELLQLSWVDNEGKELPTTLTFMDNTSIANSILLESGSGNAVSCRIMNKSSRTPLGSTSLCIADTLFPSTSLCMVGFFVIAVASIVVIIATVYKLKRVSITGNVNPQIVSVGQPVTISCDVQGCTSSSLQVHLSKWEDSKNQTLYMHSNLQMHKIKGSKTIKEDKERTEIENGTVVNEYKNGLFQVTLPHVELSNSGQYVCGVQCNDTYKEAVLDVVVKGMINVTVSGAAIFPCMLSGSHDPSYLKFQWKKNSPGKMDDAGEYICLAESKLLRKETIFNLSVKVVIAVAAYYFVERKAWTRALDDKDTVTLDADSAHPCISIENRSFTHGTEILPVSPNPQRFDGIVAVLGDDGFSSGNHYWEVDIGNSSDWDVGVARKSIKRKGNITLSPKEGFWVLGFTGRDYFAKTDPWTRITVQRKPERIGIHLRFQENKVTFFNVTDKSILFEFKACEFSEAIYPFFKNGDKGKTMHLTAK